MKPTFFGKKHTAAEKVTQTYNGWNGKSPVRLNTLFFKEWMTATLSVTKTDTLPQRKDSYKYRGKINILPLKM